MPSSSVASPMRRRGLWCFVTRARARSRGPQRLRARNAGGDLRLADQGPRGANAGLVHHRVRRLCLPPRSCPGRMGDESDGAGHGAKRSEAGAERHRSTTRHLSRQVASRRRRRLPGRRSRFGVAPWHRAARSTPGWRWASSARPSRLVAARGVPTSPLRPPGSPGPEPSCPARGVVEPARPGPPGRRGRRRAGTSPCRDDRAGSPVPH